MAAGDRVKNARKSMGMTQKTLAKLAGCSQQTIVDLETGNVTWSRFMPVIADELGVSLHWVETGEGPRERPGKSQGAVPIVQWDFFAHAALTGEDSEVIDWAEGCPVDNSGSTVVVIVDESTAFGMAGQVAVGDWLFVDRANMSDGLVVVMMPGWERAEVRELLTSGTHKYLRQSNPAMPEAQLVTACTTLKDYQALADAESQSRASGNIPADEAPALLLGRVVFQGQPRY